MLKEAGVPPDYCWALLRAGVRQLGALSGPSACLPHGGPASVWEGNIIDLQLEARRSVVTWQYQTL